MSYSNNFSLVSELSNAQGTFAKKPQRKKNILFILVVRNVKGTILNRTYDYSMNGGSQEQGCFALICQTFQSKCFTKNKKGKKY